MEYVCTDARFKFFNGKKIYTVHFAYGVSTWYVFEDEKDSDALWWKKIKPSEHRSPNHSNAEDILEEYLETVTVS